MNIKELLIKQAKIASEKSAVIFEDQSISFKELKNTSFQFANYLKSLSVNKGDKVAILLANIPETIFAILGVFSLGVTVVPLDFMLSEVEAVNFINHSQAKVLITQPKKGIELSNLKEKCPGLEKIIVCRENIEGFVFWNSILEKESFDVPSSDVEDNDISSIFYTSGSTGKPKGVILSFGHLDNSPKTIDYFLKVSPKDVFLCGGVPFSHIGGLGYILLMVYFSTAVVLMERFQPLEFIKNIERNKVTIFCIVPAMYVAILSLKESDKFNLSSLRYAVVFGAPSSGVLLRKFNKIAPSARLSNGWGMTETAAPNCMLSPKLDKIESIGRFAPWMQAKIVDDNDNSLGANEKGELLVKGEAVMEGYYKQEQLTKEVLGEDGWLKTGDIAYYDKQGLFYIVGRKKDILKVAGEIVIPAEVEKIIYRHPKVKEVAVIGIEDKLRGEVPKAFIVAEDNQKVEPGEIKEFLKEQVAHFKIPHSFEFVNYLPKNRTGKIDKTKLS